jgi:hypothetical protein
VENYLDEARAKGFITIRIIYGKGISVQREIVRTVWIRKYFFTHYEDTLMDAGSWSAI